MATPTHHPIFGVHMPESTIQKIIGVFPGAKLKAIRELEKGKSYNNRIYFLTISQQGHSSLFESSVAEDVDIVLKANGRFFGAEKIQNEVGSLRLVRQYCPSIAAPRVLAWSEDGTKIVVADPIKDEPKTLNLNIEVNGDGPSHGGWILMSRVPGESVSRFNLDADGMRDVMLLLADIVTQWRTQIPPQKFIGNFQHRSSNSESELSVGTDRNELNMVIRGILLDGINITEPLHRPDQYHRIKIEEKIKEIQTSETHAPNRHLIPKLQDFLDKTLPRLRMTGCSTDVPRYVFTHYDLSPRNVLLSESREITGIVDFEWAGFFGEIDEFLNDYSANLEDWGELPYQAYLERLEANGINTPLKGIRNNEWEKARCLDKLLENIAPWWLPGGKEGAELEAELQKAAGIVTDNIAKLESD